MPNQTAPVTAATDIPTAGAVAGSSTEPVISITVKPSPFGWLLDGLVISPANTGLRIRYRAMPAEILPAGVEKLTAELLAELQGLPVAVRTEDAPPQDAAPEKDRPLSSISIAHASAEACRLDAKAKQLLEWIEQHRASGEVVTELLLARHTLASLHAEQAAIRYKSLIEHHAGASHAC